MELMVMQNADNAATEAERGVMGWRGCRKAHTNTHIEVRIIPQIKGNKLTTEN